MLIFANNIVHSLMKELAYILISLVLQLGLYAQIPANYYDAAQIKLKPSLNSIAPNNQNRHQTNQYSELWRFTRTDKHSFGQCLGYILSCTSSLLPINAVITKRM